jgi:hypothetical protein
MAQYVLRFANWVPCSLSLCKKFSFATSVQQRDTSGDHNLSSDIYRSVKLLGSGSNSNQGACFSYFFRRFRHNLILLKAKVNSIWSCNPIVTVPLQPCTLVETLTIEKAKRKYYLRQDQNCASELSL